MSEHRPRIIFRTKRSLQTTRIIPTTSIHKRKSEDAPNVYFFAIIKKPSCTSLMHFSFGDISLKLCIERKKYCLYSQYMNTHSTTSSSTSLREDLLLVGASSKLSKKVGYMYLKMKLVKMIAKKSRLWEQEKSLSEAINFGQKA